jgi:hypothetical protein
MPADTTDITKMPMPGGNVNAPASGTYGEGAALENLKRQLPSPAAPGPSAQNPVAPMPSPPGGGMVPAPAPGVPPALLAPTQRPDVPVSTPLAGVGGPAPMTQSAAQRRLAVLDALANNPDVSEQTREWASTLISQLAGRQQ